MGLFERFPYTNFHELNMEWLLKKMKELAKTVDQFIATESLKFADPIIWDITTQYQKSTIVLDPTGNAYLSVQPVPAGIQLNNEDYWLEIFNFTDYTRTANKNLTVNVETNTTRATAAYNVDDWLIWEDVLYRVTAAIAIDDTLIVAPAAGSNIVHFTVEDFIKAWILTMQGMFNTFTHDTNLTIQQYKDDIDASELAFTNNLQYQFDQVLAGATVDSEVINARIGYNNVIWTTLGEAIRKQAGGIHDGFISLMNEIDALKILNINFFPSSGYTDGHYLNPSNGNISTLATSFYTDYIYVKENHTYALLGFSNAIQVCFYDINKQFISGLALSAGTTSFATPANCEFIRMSSTIAGRTNYNLIDSTSPIATAQGTSYFIEMLKNYALKTHDYEVLVASVASILPDLNNAEVNKAYNVTLSAYMINGIPAHMPYNIYLEPFTLMTFSNKSGYKMQYIFGCTGVFMRIYASGTWLDWRTIKKPVAHVPNVTALIQLVESGLPCKINLDVDVELYSGYKTAKGSDYWDNYVGYSISGDRNDSGLYLHPHVDFNGNGHMVAFSPALSDITVAIQRDFSPFNLGGDNILENVFIDIGQGSGSGACRYAIHDDFAITPEGITIKNVHMTGTGHSGALIGAGVKPYSTHTVENCVCVDNAGSYDIAYHSNSAGTQAPSYLVIKNCYCEKSIIIRYIGANQIMTPCLINGNHAYSITKEAGTGAIYDNMELLAWNNDTVI